MSKSTLLALTQRFGVVVVAGEVDCATAPALAAELRPLVERGGHVRVNCRDVSFMGVAGVRALENASKTLGTRGRLALVDASLAVLRVIDIVGLREAIDLRPVSNVATPPFRRESGSTHG